MRTPMTSKMNNETREILLHGNIGPGEITSDRVASMLNALGEGPVTVGINSRGGNVVEGLGIYNLLKGRPGVTTRNDGIAASIASVIFCAGSKRVASQASFVVVHRPYAELSGNDEELREEAGNLSKMTDALLGVYAEVCKKPKAEMLEALDNRKWFNADEALEWGLATEVCESSAAKNLSAVLGEYFNSLQMPARHNHKNKMDTEKLQAELAALKETMAKLESDLKTANATIAARDAEINTTREAQAKAFAKAAVTAGRIKAEVEAKWVEFHMANPTNAEAMLPDAPKTNAGNPPIPLGNGGTEMTAAQVVETFNKMKPGPERSAFYAKNRALIVG